MEIERAVDILDPAKRHKDLTWEDVQEACAMGAEALKNRSQWSRKRKLTVTQTVSLHTTYFTARRAGRYSRTGRNIRTTVYAGRK